MEDFIKGPLMTWLRTFPDVPQEVTFSDLINRGVLSDVLQTFESEVFDHHYPLEISTENNHHFRSKVQKIENLIRSLKYYYEEILGQTVVIKLPNSLLICEEPPSKDSLIEMDKLLLLILGAAVQCSQKETVIESLKNLPVSVQEAIVIKIKEVTDNPTNVWSPELSDPSALPEDQRNLMYVLLVSHVKRLVKERDEFAKKMVELSVVTRSKKHRGNCGANRDEDEDDSGNRSVISSSEMTHRALEVSEYKAKIRKMNQELNDKTENLAEATEDNHRKAQIIHKLKQENLQLVQEARKAKCHQDELDILQERASKVDKLEADILVFKDKVSQLEYCKSRVDECREDNRILTEAKEMLMEQVEQARKRCAKMITLETEILQYRTEINSMTIERENDQRRINELSEENMSLSLNTKNSLSESQSLLLELQSLKNQDKDTNVLAEQLGKDRPLIHRLELENQHLKNELENLKVEGFHAHSDKILELESENKKYSLKVGLLEERINKEAEECGKLEKNLVRLEDKYKQNQVLVATLKESEEQTRIEKDAEIESLKKQIESLRKRQEQSQNEQISLLTEENQKLTKETTVIRRQLSTVEREKSRIQTDLLNLKDDASHEASSSKATIEALASEIDSLKEKNFTLEMAKEDSESDRKHLHNKYAESRSEVRKLMEKIEDSCKRGKDLAIAERERDELRSTVKDLRGSNETIKKSHDEIYSKYKTAESELNRSKRQVENMEKRVKEVENANADIEEENRKLKKQNEHLKDTARKVEKLEKDNIKFEGDHDLVKRQNASLLKEIERTKAGLSLRDATIDEQNSKFLNLERENEKLNSQLKELEDKKSKLEELEQEMRNLNQSAVVATKTCTTLRERLVEEKVKTENLAQEIDFINDQLLHRFGFNKEALKSNEKIDCAISSERVDNLEGSLNIILENRNKKIKVLESKMKELSEQKNALSNEVELLQIKVEGGDAKSEIEKQLNEVLKEKEISDAENMKLQVKLSQLENKISLFQTEKAHINQELVKLTEDRAALQVENTTLNSQSAMLLNQINQLQSANVKMENDKEKSEKLRTELNKDKKKLIIDLERLQKLHDNLQTDYDKLLEEKDTQREVEKVLRKDLRKLQAMSLSLNEDQDELIRAKQAIDMDRETLRTDAKTLANLRSEHARLKEDFRSLFTSDEKIKQEFCNLQTDYKSLKTLHNSLMLQHTEIQGEMENVKHKNVSLRIDNTKLTNKCEVLTKLNDSLEDDRKGLMTQVELLLTQYHDLLTQTLYDKEHYHEEEKVYTDRVNHLARQKEKLEEKIFEQYKKMESYTPKKSGFGSQIVQKMRKASSHLMLSKSRTVASANSNIINNNSSSSSSMMSGGAAVNVRARGGTHRLPRPGPIHEDGIDSSSLGSGGNDSLDSGSHSPNTTGGDNNAVEGRRGKFDSHDADSVSINSIVSSSGHSQNAVPGQNYYSDEIPTRDLGPDRLFSNSSSHGEVGLPNVQADNRCNRRSSHHYFDNDRSSSSDRSSTPRLASWKSDNSSPAPSNGSQENGAPPIKPRKYSGVPPKRPPKPIDATNHRPKSDSNINVGDEDVDDSVETNKAKLLSKKTEEWYEYGCV